jgi:tetratricopeptide (TPR) repeat protein
MIRFLPAILFFLLPLLAQEIRLSKGFDHFYNLEYDEAIAEFSRAIKGDPDNPERYNHLAQAILYRAMYRGGALESELVTGNNSFLRRPKLSPSAEDQKLFEDAIQRAMQLAQARIEKNQNDLRASYSLGVSHGIRANYNFLVRKAWMDALRDATAARKLHNRVSELDPSMVDARLVQGAHDYVVGSLPWHIKMIGFLAGFRGDRERGIKTLELVAHKGEQNRVEAGILLAAIYRRERRAGQAIPLLEDMVRRFPRNHLLRFEMVQMYGDLGKKDEALAVLRQMEELKGKGAPGYRELPLEKIQYSKGNILFWYNDLDSAMDNLKKATSKAAILGTGTGGLAWMRLGQTYDLKGQRSLAVDAYKQAIQFAPESDAAKEARRYLSNPYRRG